MSHVIKSVEELTPQRLTDILYRDHHLKVGDVSTIIGNCRMVALTAIVGPISGTKGFFLVL